jgi:hypothetical protein
MTEETRTKVEVFFNLPSGYGSLAQGLVSGIVDAMNTTLLNAAQALFPERQAEGHETEWGEESSSTGPSEKWYLGWEPEASRDKGAPDAALSYSALLQPLHQENDNEAPCAGDTSTRVREAGSMLQSSFIELGLRHGEGLVGSMGAKGGGRKSGRSALDSTGDATDDVSGNGFTDAQTARTDTAEFGAECVGDASGSGEACAQGAAEEPRAMCDASLDALSSAPAAPMHVTPPDADAPASISGSKSCGGSSSREAGATRINETDVAGAGMGKRRGGGCGGCLAGAVFEGGGGWGSPPGAFTMSGAWLLPSLEHFLRLSVAVYGCACASVLVAVGV